MAKNNPLKIAQGFPGQMGLLAEQMNRGFGGGLLAQQQYLDSIYDPVVMPQPFDFGGDEKKKKTGDKNKPTTTGGRPITNGGVRGGVQVRNYADPFITVNGQQIINPDYRPIGTTR